MNKISYEVTLYARGSVIAEIKRWNLLTWKNAGTKKKRVFVHHELKKTEFIHTKPKKKAA